MLYSALMFLVVGLIAGALNLAGVSTVAVQISWILFLIGISWSRSMCSRDAPRGLCDRGIPEYSTVFRRDDLTLT